MGTILQFTSQKFILIWLDLFHSIQFHDKPLDVSKFQSRGCDFSSEMVINNTST